MSQGWHLKNIYIYLVSFVTLMMIVFGLITFFRNAMNYVYPTSYSYYQTLMDIEYEYLNTNRPVPPVAELEKIREQRLELEKRSIQDNRINQMRNLISSLAVWLIPIPFYLYHWRRVKKDVFTEEGEDNR